ncbi:MAG: A24 family peptidase [Polyangiaceae bacterium]
MPHLFIAVASILVSAVAAVTDFRSGRIPNPLTITAMLFGFAIQGAFGGVAGAVESAVGLLICAAVPGSAYWATKGAAIGGGDLKLFAALGALLGPMHGLEVELSSFLLLGVFALFRLAYLGQLFCTAARSVRAVAGVFVPRLRNQIAEDSLVMTEMRMGPAIAVAVVTVLGLPAVLRWLPWLA